MRGSTETRRERRQGERRHLVDRRSPFPRRSGVDRRQYQRRQRAVAVQRERRLGEERRQRERRRSEERRGFTRRIDRRRRNTPKPYSDWELASIQRQHAEPGTRPKCPVCNGVFTLGVEQRRGNHRTRRVQCTSCGQIASVSDSVTARIIIVAQGEVMRQTLRAVLSEDGHEVLEVADAALGLWAYGQGPADVVLLDLRAPGGMSAEEFVRLLRREHPDARVVAVSTRPSMGSDDPVALAQAVGATGLIRLPCSQQEILGTLQQARL